MTMRVSLPRSRSVWRDQSAFRFYGAWCLALGALALFGVACWRQG